MEFRTFGLLVIAPCNNYFQTTALFGCLIWVRLNRVGGWVVGHGLWVVCHGSWVVGRGSCLFEDKKGYI